MTYGFCLMSSQSVQVSWTHCCFDEMMDGCQVFDLLQGKEQEKGCLEHVPTPPQKQDNTLKTTDLLIIEHHFLYRISLLFEQYLIPLCSVTLVYSWG